MGYELRLHIGQEYSHNTEDFDREWGRTIEEIAEVRLSKPGYDSRIYKLMQERQEAQEKAIKDGGIRYALYTDVYFEEQNEYARLFEDKYGKPVTPIPFREAYAALLHDYADSIGPHEYRDGYRRFALAISIFEPILTRFPEGLGKDENARPLVVLGYGY